MAVHSTKKNFNPIGIVSSVFFFPLLSCSTVIDVYRVFVSSSFFDHRGLHVARRAST